jgi:peptidoglycan/xylan/chitin deacetylase (PgdA/CDA1 family)
MRWIDTVSAQIARSPLRPPARGPLIVTYHGLGGPDGVDPADFEAHLELLIARRRVKPLREALETLGTPDAKRTAAITFDDAYRDYAELAVPILERLKLHATLFVPAGMMGKSNEWDRGVLAERPILDAAGLRELDPKTTELGAHGYSHRRLCGLTAAELHQEIVETRSILEALSPGAVQLFAYPYGQGDDFDEATERAVEQAGFIAACSTRFGTGSGARERFRLRRVGVDARDTRETVGNKLDGAYDWMAAKEGVGLRLRRMGWRS